MATHQLQTGSPIEYPAGDVLAPDIVTEQLALEATKDLLERARLDGLEQRCSSLELGIGPGAFSRTLLDTSALTLDITGIDTNADALAAAKQNLSSHKRLGKLTLVHGDWNDDATFDGGPFDYVYFNPPYYPPGKELRAEFANSPASAVFTEDPREQYASMLPRIVQNLAIGGMAIIRYPGDGSLTFAGEDAKASHDPWVTFEEADRIIQRLVRRAAWLQKVMPADTRSHTWQTEITGRRINAEIFTRIGNGIANAPKIIRDMDAYWKAYDI